MQNNYFNTITQFDEQFDDMFKIYPKSKKGTACFVFAVTVAQDIAKNVSLDASQYINAINRAIMITCMTNTATVKKFNDAIKLINVNTFIRQDIGQLALIDPLLLSIVPNIDNAPKNSNWYCTIIKKDGAFFAIGAKQIDMVYTYYVRDINKKNQYDFTNRSNLVDYLKNIYNLTTPVIIDGVVLSDLSTVEYLIISSHIVDIFENEINRVMSDNLNQDEVDIHELQRRFGGDQGYHIGLNLGNINRDYLYNASDIEVDGNAGDGGDDSDDSDDGNNSDGGNNSDDGNNSDGGNNSDDGNNSDGGDDGNIRDINKQNRQSHALNSDDEYIEQDPRYIINDDDDDNDDDDNDDDDNDDDDNDDDNDDEDNDIRYF